MALEGVVHDGVIVPDDATALAEGTRVRICPAPPGQPIIQLWTEYVCDTDDLPARERLQRVLNSLPVQLVSHWEEAGIEIWTYEVANDQLKVRAEYGEVYLTGARPLLVQLLSDMSGPNG